MDSSRHGLRLSWQNHAAPPAHPVLPARWDSYPGHQGRLSMPYCPFRHFLHPVAQMKLVRLACVIHAANVRSEPGSNPSKKLIQLLVPVAQNSLSLSRRICLAYFKLLLKSPLRPTKAQGSQA